jgi:hypothetical protein
MTFLEMVTAVGTLINQDVSTDNELVTNSEVKINLNRGYQKVVNRIASLGQDYYVRLAKANLVADQSLYGLPSDYRRMIRVELDYGGDDNRYKANRTDTNAYGHPVDTSISETSPQYSVRGNNIELNPTPEDAVTSGLWMWYVETVNDLSDDDDEPNLPPEFSDLPIEYAVAKAKARQGLMDEAQLSLSEFYRELDEMTNAIVNTNSDDPEQVVIRDAYFDE